MDAEVKNWILLLVVVSQIFSGFADVFWGHFEETRVIENGCYGSWTIDTRVEPTLFSCAFWCSRVKECRRILYVQSTLQCSLEEDGQNCLVGTLLSGSRCFRRVIGCHGDDCTCLWGYYGNRCEHIVIDCKDATNRGILSSNIIITNIKPLSAPEPFEVTCWLQAYWSMEIFARNEFCSTENFNRSMTEYEVGFGEVSKNRWLGFYKILQIMANPHDHFSLHVTLYDASYSSCVAVYQNFTLTGGSDGYRFYSSYYTPLSSKQPCGDSMIGSNNTLDLRGQPFSTYDMDHTSYNCPGMFGGGWWFADDVNCSSSLMTGTIPYWRNIIGTRSIPKISIKLMNL